MRSRDALVALGSLALLSCKTTPCVTSLSAPQLPEVTQVDPSLSPLTWVGGISILGGIILMTVTRFLGLPLRGAIPLVAGIALVVGAWALQMYADVAILPIAITSGVVGSLAVIASARKLFKEQQWTLFKTPSMRSSPAPERGSSSTYSVLSPDPSQPAGSKQPPAN
jgi:hypothetical protein